MRPFLEIAYHAKQQGEDEVKLRDVINALADHFQLIEEERSETLPSGRQLVIDNRIGWARTYLTKAGLLEATLARSEPGNKKNNGSSVDGASAVRARQLLGST